MANPFTSKRQGFTLIELVVTLAIIAIVSTILIVSFTSSRQRANDSKRKSDLEAIKGALALYYADNGFYPASQPATPLRLDFITQITNCTGVAPCPPGPAKVYLNDIQTSYTNPVKIGSPDAHHYCYMGQASYSSSYLVSPGNDCDNLPGGTRCNYYRLFAYLDQPTGNTYHCDDGSGIDHSYTSHMYMIEP